MIEFDVSEWIDINKATESRECDIFQIKGLSFNQMSAMGSMMY